MDKNNKPALTVLIASAGCSGSGCPTTYATDRGTRIIQGGTVARDVIEGMPGHESAVEVPAEFYDSIGQAWAREHGLI